MVMRAFEHWRRLEREAGKGVLLHMTGILDIGEQWRLADLLTNYKSLGMPVEVFSGETEQGRAQFRARFPTIGLGPKQHAVFQADTGMLCADVSVGAMLEISEKKGAKLLLDDSVVKIDREARTVTTQKGVVCSYDTLVVAAGPWTNAVLTSASLPLLPLAVSNEQAVYLQPKQGSQDSDMEPSKSPVVVEWDANIYAVPHLPGGVPGCKIGAHAAGEFMNNEEFVLPRGAEAMLQQLEQPSKQVRVVIIVIIIIIIIITITITQVHSVQSGSIHLPMLHTVQASASLTFPLLDPNSGAETYTRCL